MLDIMLLPFIFIYRGVMLVLLLPYYCVLGIGRAFNKNKVNPKVMNELKKGEKIKVVKGVRSAYDEPYRKEIKLSPEEEKKHKELSKYKHQKEFEKLVAKAREEEKKRIKEQERLRKEREKKAKEQALRDAEREKRENLAEEQREKARQQKLKNGEPVTFKDKLKNFYKKLTYNKKLELEYQAKKHVLDEQFKDQKVQAARFEKPLLFSYIAKNPKGVIEKSTIEALSSVDVHSFLLAEGYEVYEIIPAKVSKINLGSYKFKRSKLIFYLTQLSAYLKSGIALADSVKILDDQAKNVKEKKVWRAVYYDLSMGDVLSSSMEKRGNVFPKLLINMVKTAEMTGNLPETLDDMVEYYTEAESTRKQMKSAMMYPLIVTIFATCVVAFILLWVVPQFVSIYADLGSDLPAITKAIISISDFLKNYIIYILIVLIVLALCYIYLYKNVKGFRRAMQEFAMHLPIFGEIIIYNEVTIFAKTFANLINHNVFITDSIDVLSKITDNEVYKKLIYDTAKNLTKGDTLSSAFKDHWAFPNIAYQMLLTGEKTGRLGPMMERVSDYYQEQHRTIINSMKSLIEPVLIISLAVVVGGILLSVILPMYSMYDAL